MNAKHYADLEDVIQKWADNACCENEWPDFITGDATIHHMTKEASQVLDACVESQTYALREGFVKTV